MNRKHPRQDRQSASLQKITLPILLTAVALISIPGAVLIRFVIQNSRECEATILSAAADPGGNWKAQVNETVCEFAIVTEIIASVDLVSDLEPSKRIAIVAVGTTGNDNQRPRIAWTAPDVLRVTVPNISYLKVLTSQYDGIRIDLRYDPDDPAARAEWRRKLGEQADPDAPK